MSRIVIKGDIVSAETPDGLTKVPGGYLAAEDGIIEGVYSVLPEKYADGEITDWSGCIIAPAFIDAHLHAPQFPMMGMGMDLQLLEWLDRYTFRNEARFTDIGFARRTYKKLANALVAKGTTRVVMFSSLHREATHVLCEELESAGVSGYVGKVNMDRNAPEYLCETTEESISETKRFVEECRRYTRIKPIITPRFTPTCSDSLMRALGDISAEYNLKIQSHLSENQDEIAWVKKLHPDTERYYESYEKFGLFNDRTVMAHCVYSDAEERRAMKENGVTAAICTDSNTNIVSGIVPARLFMEEGVNCALGSDIAGGAELSMLKNAAQVIRASKLRWLNSGKKEKFLTACEGFYLATSGGAKFFGDRPGFKKGQELHAVVLSDRNFAEPVRPLTLEERLERIMYLHCDDDILAVYNLGRIK